MVDSKVFVDKVGVGGYRQVIVLRRLLRSTVPSWWCGYLVLPETHPAVEEVREAHARGKGPFWPRLVCQEGSPGPRRGPLAGSRVPGTGSGSIQGMSGWRR
jgi:hypothetical protein